jgi:hypothetical protein
VIREYLYIVENEIKELIKILLFLEVCIGISGLGGEHNPYPLEYHVCWETPLPFRISYVCWETPLPIRISCLLGNSTINKLPIKT